MSGTHPLKISRFPQTRYFIRLCPIYFQNKGSHNTCNKMDENTRLGSKYQIPVFIGQPPFHYQLNKSQLKPPENWFLFV